MKKKIFLWAGVFPILLLIMGCGYHLVGHGSSLPKNVRTIAIPTFDNVSSEPGIERTFTQVVREEFVKDGRLKVIGVKRADWIVRGEIRSYFLKPVSFDSRDNVTAYWIEMVIFVEIKDVRNDKIILKQDFTPHWDYQVTSAVSSSNVSRLEGIQNAAKDFGKTLISLVIEGF